MLEAALGLEAAPAHRGLAYAIFEDLELADFANRVPRVSFEVFADGAAPMAMLADLGRDMGCSLTGALPAARWTGFSVGRPVPLAKVIEVVGEAEPLTIVSAEHGLRLSAARPGEAIAVLGEDALLAGEHSPVGLEKRRDRTEQVPRIVTVRAGDPSRAYQPGLQRAVRGDVVHGGTDALDFPAAMPAEAAKAIAEDRLSRMSVRRLRTQARVSLARLELQAGDTVSLSDGSRWVVRRTEIEGFGMTCSLELSASAPSVPAAADAGTAQVNPDIPQGETELRLVELPPLGGEPEGAVRIYAAAGGASPGWRYAEILTSLDGRASWQAAGHVSTPAKMGALAAPLTPGDWSSWDEANALDVTLIDDRPLVSRSRLAVLNGANLILVGEELLQFRSAEEIAPRRWRLTGLLRGRRGTEAASLVPHAEGTPVLLLEPEALFPLDLDLPHIGAELMVKAVGPNDSAAEVAPASIEIAGRSLKPLSPVRLQAAFAADGGLAASWVRRSRHGFAWLDGTGAPLSEETEVYAVTVESGGLARTWTVGTPAFALSASEQQAAFGEVLGSARVEVRQISRTVGPGAPASVLAG